MATKKKAAAKKKPVAKKKAPAKKAAAKKIVAPVTTPVINPEVTETPTVVTHRPVVGTAPLQPSEITNGAQEVKGNTAIPVHEVNEIWESEDRKRKRLESDPSLRAL